MSERKDIGPAVKCKCGAEPNETHKCPYAQDVNNDDKSECNCCDECTQNCRDDI